MSKYKKYIVLLILMIIIGLCYPSIIYSQPVDPGCDPLDPACPIDGGLGFLVAGAILICGKRFHNMYNKPGI